MFAENRTDKRLIDDGCCDVSLMLLINQYILAFLFSRPHLSQHFIASVFAFSLFLLFHEKFCWKFTTVACSFRCHIILLDIRRNKRISGRSFYYMARYITPSPTTYCMNALCMNDSFVFRRTFSFIKICQHGAFLTSN